MANTDELQSLISKCLQDFYERRVRKLEKLRLKHFLRRKNPYLFKALDLEHKRPLRSLKKYLLPILVLQTKLCLEKFSLNP
jgi:hypothetical protein